MGKNTNVHAVGRADQIVERISEHAPPPGLAIAVADEDLGDPLRTRIPYNFADGIFAFENFHDRARLASQREITVEGLLVFGGKAGLPDIGDKELAVKTLDIAAAAINQAFRVGVRRNTNQNALLGAPELLDAIVLQILLELPVHDLGGKNESEFTKLVKMALADVIAGSPLDHFRRSIHHHDLVRGLDEFFGNRFDREFTGNGQNLIPALGDVLEVQRRDNRDPF